MDADRSPGAALSLRRPAARTAVVVVLFALIFVIRLGVHDPDIAIGVLLLLPVGLSGAWFGRRGGVLAAALAIGLLSVWAEVLGDGLTAVGWAPRVTAFVVLGVTIGWYSDRLRTVRRQVEAMLAGSPDAMIAVDERGVIADANARACAMFGYTDDSLVGRAVHLLIPEAIQLAHADALRTYLASTGLDPARGPRARTGRRADGTEFPIEVHLTPTSERNRLLVLATIRDVTARLASEQLLRESRERFEAAFDHAPVGMALVALDGRILQANERLATMTGYTRHELAGWSSSALIDPRDRQPDAERLRALATGREDRYRAEMRLLDASGQPLWVQASAALVRPAGAESGYVVTHFEDVTERKHYESQLQYLADHDTLTGLFNRRRFVEEVEEHLARGSRYGPSGAVIMLDLDNFKYVNDTLGHGAGDAMIRAVAAALQQRARASDVLARLGGDEFAMLLPTATPAEAGTVAQAMLDAVREHEGASWSLMGSRLRTTASVGVVLLSPYERWSEEVLAHADLAMYAAKEAGRDRFVVFDPTAPYLARSSARFRWLERVRTALEHDQFSLQAQPIVSLATAGVSHYELLVRLLDEGELILPDRFLEIAERHGLAPSIDRWVVHEAVRLAAAHRDVRDLRLEVNLSGDSLVDPELPDLIESAMREVSIDPGTLIFEVTETTVIANIEAARRFIERVTDLGCRFALDDFGAGFGSFYYLKHLPCDYLKIDGEFVRDLPHNRTDQLIVQAVVEAARGLGKQTIAEYVQDEDTMSMLRHFGVDFAQGYHVGRPTDPAAAFVRAARRA